MAREVDEQGDPWPPEEALVVTDEDGRYYALYDMAPSGAYFVVRCLETGDIGTLYVVYAANTLTRRVIEQWKAEWVQKSRELIDASVMANVFAEFGVKVPVSSIANLSADQKKHLSDIVDGVREIAVDSKAMLEVVRHVLTKNKEKR